MRSNEDWKRWEAAVAASRTVNEYLQAFRPESPPPERPTRFPLWKGPFYFLSLHVVAVMNERGHDAKIFELYRSPARQAELYAKGRSRPGRKVTWAKPFESAHQFMLASDIISAKHGWFKDGSLEQKTFFDDLSMAWEVVSDRFKVPVDHGHHWKKVDSAHCELVGWRDIRERFKTALGYNVPTEVDLLRLCEEVLPDPQFTAQQKKVMGEALPW